MPRRRLAIGIVSGVVVASACVPVSAQIFKCPSGAGYILQQAPCPGLGQSGGRLLFLPNGRPAPVAVPVAASGSEVPKQGRVLGRTPRPGSEVASAPN